MGNDTQSNTKQGKLIFPAAEDLTGLEGALVELVNSSGVTKVQRPNALMDIPFGVLVEGDVSGADVAVVPLSPDRNIRVRAKSTGNPGDILVLGDPSTAADSGKVRVLPATAGSYVQVGVAEEIFVDGQLVLLRPCSRIVRVASADTLTALTFTSGGATGAEVGALRDALKTILEAQGLML